MEKQLFNTGNPGELILPGKIHEMKMIRLKLDERPVTISEEEKGKLERRLFELEEHFERVTY